MPHKMPIDLEYSMKDTMGPVEISDKMYPSLHLEWPSDYDLPESGEMTVTFRKTGSRKEKRNGKTRFTVDLEIKSIESVEEGEEEGETKEESGSEALDRHMKEATEKKGKAEDSDEDY